MGEVLVGREGNLGPRTEEADCYRQRAEMGVSGVRIKPGQPSGRPFSRDFAGNQRKKSRKTHLTKQTSPALKTENQPGARPHFQGRVFPGICAWAS